MHRIFSGMAEICVGLVGVEFLCGIFFRVILFLERRLYQLDDLLLFRLMFLGIQKSAVVFTLVELGGQ